MAVEFADGTDFYANGKRYAMNMQMILNEDAKLHEAKKA